MKMLEDLVEQVGFIVDTRIGDYVIKELSEKYGINEAFLDNGYEKNWMLYTEYYKYLVAITELLTPSPIEFGTQTGAGTACFLSHPSVCLVDTVDVNPAHVSKKIMNDSRVIFHHAKDERDCLNFNYHNFDLIFVDIGHDGIIEKEIHEKILKSSFRGIVLWDDILLNNSMERFWNDMRGCQKVSTDWHGNCGFGVTKYG